MGSQFLYIKWNTVVFFIIPLTTLTYCGLVTPYGDIYLVNIGSGNGLLPDGNNPLLEPMLTYHQ